MNKSGYKDPTAELAIGRVKHKQKLPKYVKAFHKVEEGLAELFGFKIIKHATLRDQGGRIYSE